MLKIKGKTYNDIVDAAHMIFSLTENGCLYNETVKYIFGDSFQIIFEGQEDLTIKEAIKKMESYKNKYKQI